MQLPATWRGWLAIVLATIAAATGVVITVSSGDGPTTITVTVQGPVGPTTVTTTPQAVTQAADVGDHADAKDETPTGVTGIAEGVAQQEAFAKRDDLPLEIPAAAPQQRGCRTRLVANRSSRNGVKPRLFVAHYTVSPNRPGYSDVNAITALFDRPSFSASSTYVIDKNGNCNYIVREAEKPWTQATFNPVSISAEIINTGSERPLFTKVGLSRFARVVSDSTRRWGIPVRRGKVSGCRVTRSGILDHNSLGACGGGHHDVTPFNVNDLIAAVKRHRAGQGATARRCAELTRIRRYSHKRGWTQARIARARKLKTVLGVKANACR